MWCDYQRFSVFVYSKLIALAFLCQVGIAFTRQNAPSLALLNP